MTPKKRQRVKGKYDGKTYTQQEVDKIKDEVREETVRQILQDGLYIQLPDGRKQKL